MPTRRKQLYDLVQSAIGAKANFDAFWALAGDGRSYWEHVDFRHSAFFRLAHDSTYTAFLIYFAQMYDRRRDVSSLPNYFALLRRTNQPPRVKELWECFRSLSIRAEPLVTARNNAVAHVNARQSESEIFAELNITWDQVRSVVYESAELVFQLSGAASPGDIGIPKDRQLEVAANDLIGILPQNGA